MMCEIAAVECNQSLKSVASLSSKSAPSVRNTVFLQAIATLLIANSHLKSFYPRPWMGVDGLFGNSMFFLLSGYGITISLVQRKQHFHQYYLRRVLRLYPALWLVEIVFHFLLQGFSKSAGWRDYLEFLVYPTAYGYIRQIMVFYVLFFLLRPWLRAGVLIKLMAGLYLPLLILCVFDVSVHPMERLQLGGGTNDLIWWVFFFQIMLLGGYLAMPGRNPTAKAGPKLFLLTVSLAAYIGLKSLMVLGVKVPGSDCSFARTYFLLFLLMPLMLSQALALGTSAGWLARLKRCRYVQWFVGLIGGLTLEIYLVHVFVLENERVRELAFPLNVAAVFLVTIPLAWCISQATRMLRRILEGTTA